MELAIGYKLVLKKEENSLYVNFSKLNRQKLFLILSLFKQDIMQ